MCGPRLWRVGKGVLELLISNGSGTFDSGDLDLLPSDPKINKFPLLYMTDVWTKIEEGRSRGSLVIGRKQKVTDRQTDRPTDMCKARCHLFFEGGITTTNNNKHTIINDGQ